VLADEAAVDAEDVRRQVQTRSPSEIETTDCCGGNCAPPPEKNAFSAAVPFAATVLCCR
jgi:hypothetical protein